MSEIDRYLQAATRENTRRGYRAAIRHFEEEWGGFLPATADSVARYLADHAQTHALSTLKQRLAALGQWHRDQGFPDPTKAPMVKKVLRGIGELHPARAHQARPLQIEQLLRVDASLAQRCQGEGADALRASRDRALILLGFWRAFRTDELCRLQVEDVEITPGVGMSLYLSRTKTVHGGEGSIFRVPALSRLCPVEAYRDWVSRGALHSGPVFRRIDRWGRIGDESLNPGSLVPLLRRILEDAGIVAADLYSGHSLRRGFASWANANHWDVKELMEYVGWKDVKSAMRYIDSGDPFHRRQIEGALFPAHRSDRD